MIMQKRIPGLPALVISLIISFLLIPVASAQSTASTKVVVIPMSADSAPAKSTYTVWGTNTCGTGDAQLYAGFVSVVSSFNGAGSAPLCLNTSVSTGWVGDDNALIWRAKFVAGSNRGQYLDGVNQAHCAVCQGQTYVSWGEQSCASGWETVYDGYLGSMVTGGGSGWSAGGPICLEANASGTWVPWNIILVRRAIGNAASRTQYQNSQDVLCRVCK